jgi:hypothetical protein
MSTFDLDDWIARLVILEKQERARQVYTDFFLQRLARWEQLGSCQAMKHSRLCVVLEVDPTTRQFIVLTAERAIERLKMMGEFSTAYDYEKLQDETADWHAIYRPEANRRPGIKAVRQFARQKEMAEYDTDLPTDTSDEEDAAS